MTTQEKVQANRMKYLLDEMETIQNNHTAINEHGEIVYHSSVWKDRYDKLYWEYLQWVNS